MQRLNQFFTKYLIYFILLLAFLLLIYRIDKPFIGHHDWNGAFWGTITRNYVGQVQKLFGQSPIFDGVNRGATLYYSNYPPLMPILFTLSSSVFGVNEMSLRLVTVLCSILLTLTIYKISALLYSKNVGLVAAVLTISTPMFLYFGKLPDHEPIVTALITFALYWYLKQKTGQRRHSILFLIFFALALLESWAPYFVLPFLWLDAYFFSQKKLNFKPLLVLIGLIVVSHLVLIVNIHGTAGLSTFLRSGLFRFNSQGFTSIISFTWPQFLVTIARFAVIYFTRILLLLTGIWLMRFIFQTFKRKLSSSDRTLCWLFFLPPLSFVLVFRNLAYIHDYKLYLFLPFIALAAAVIAVRFINKSKEILISRSHFLAHGVSLVLLLTIMTLTFTERLPYLTTLLATSFNEPGVTLGKLIAAQTEPQASILVNSGEFMSFFDVFVRFYGNRHIVSGNIVFSHFTQNPNDFVNYRYIVLIEDRPTDPEFALFLNKNYHFYTQGKFTLFDLKQPL